MTSPSPGAYLDSLNGVTAISATDIWAVGYSEATSSSIQQTLVEHWNGSAWSVIPSPNVGTASNALNGVAALSLTNIWAVGFDDITDRGLPTALFEHWDGSAWSVVPAATIPFTGASELYGVDALSATNIWAVGALFGGPLSEVQTLTEHWDGTSWSYITSPDPANAGDTELLGVSAISANDIWAVGNAQQAQYPNPALTLTEHWNGTAWSVVPSPTPSTTGFLNGVAARSTNDVWAVGSSSGTLTEHWNGTAWNVVPSPNPGDASNTLYAVTAVPSSGEFWAVGNYSTSSYPHNYTLVERWNGTSWSVVSSAAFSGTSEVNLDSVTATSPCGAWAVGLYEASYTNYVTLAESYRSPTSGILC